MPHHPAFMEEAVRVSTVVVPSTGLVFARGVGSVNGGLFHAF